MKSLHDVRGEIRAIRRLRRRMYRRGDVPSFVQKIFDERLARLFVRLPDLERIHATISEHLEVEQLLFLQSLHWYVYGAPTDR